MGGAQGVGAQEGHVGTGLAQKSCARGEGWGTGAWVGTGGGTEGSDNRGTTFGLRCTRKHLGDWVTSTER